MKAIYDIKLDWLLRKYWWKFATRRIQLSPIEFKLNFNAETGAFIIGEIVSGAVGSGTIAHIIKASATAGTLGLTTVTEGFVDNETITGSLTGSADANGVEFSPTPINEFDYIYALPPKYIQLRALYPDYFKYTLEGNFILSNESTTLDIKYTYRVVDPNAMDVSFIEAFAALLAKETAIPLVNSLRKKKSASDDFDDILADARFAGSIEDDLEEISAEDWLTERL